MGTPKIKNRDLLEFFQIYSTNLRITQHEPFIGLSWGYEELLEHLCYFILLILASAALLLSGGPPSSRCI